MTAFYTKLKNYQSLGKTYVIAEVGSNWRTRQDLLSSVVIAKACGADAVKFQYLTPSELFGPKPEIDKTFPLSQLREKADATGIDFLCSAFSVEGLKEVNKYVDAHKIASSEMCHIRLLDAVRATGKTILLSTGAYFMPDVTKVLQYLNGAEVVPLHCNVSYPTKHVNTKKFGQIQNLAALCGYSDHTTIIDAVPVLLKNLGATVYEKHFNPYGYKDTPDAPHSLNTEEFKCMVTNLRGVPNEYNEETEARLMNVRRVIATADIAVGDTFKEGLNMGIFRARKPDANGVNPFAISKLEGQRAARVVKAGDGISFLDVQVG
jgi:sialic acid synthase SpsE